MFHKVNFYYRPQQSCEGYVFTGICLSTGGVSASVHAGIPPPSRHPPGADPPGADTPWEQTLPQEQTPPPGSRHPRRSRPPRADTPPWKQTPSPQSRHHPQSRHSPRADTPREETLTPGTDGHCCERYASYWNAFLFTNKMQHVFSQQLDFMRWLTNIWLIEFFIQIFYSNCFCYFIIYSLRNSEFIFQEW